MFTKYASALNSNLSTEYKVEYTALQVSANSLNTAPINLTTPSNYYIIKQCAIFDTEFVVLVGFWFETTSQIRVRVKNVTNSTQTCTVTVFYC